MEQRGLLDRIFEAYVGGGELLAIEAGYRYGWYQQLLKHQAMTAEQLAAAANTGPRFTLEWLRQQAAGGLLSVEVEGEHFLFTLTPEARTVLMGAASATGEGTMARVLVETFAGLTALAGPLVEAWRNDADGRDERFKAFIAHQQAQLSRATAEAVPPLLQAVPEITQIVHRNPLRVADLGCGAGFHMAAMSASWSHAQCLGFEPDRAARALAERYHPRLAPQILAEDARQIVDHGSFDLITFIDTLHHMPDPVDALAAARAALSSGGVVAVLESPARDQFGDGGEPVERFGYLSSLFNCLHERIEEDGAAAVGAVVRASQVRDWSAAAGLSLHRSVDTSPDEFRVYVLSA